MSDENKQIEHAVARLEELKPGEIIVFDADEAQALKEVALWWRRFKGAFAIGGVVGSVAKWFLLFSAFIVAVRAGALDFLQSGGGK